MKIVLVIPPSAFLIDDRAFPFLGPLQIAAVAQEKGHEVRVADLTGYKHFHPEIVHAEYEPVLEDAKSRLTEYIKDADLVGFYSLAAQHPVACQLLKHTKSVNPDAITVIGGPHANTSPESCRKDGFDYVVVSDQGGGGGEPGFLKLLDMIDPTAKASKKKILGVLGAMDERIIKVASREGVKWENDKWPLPARHLIDLPSYKYEIGGKRATSIVSATGCPYACSYCSHWAGYRKLEARSSKRVREEVQLIRRNYGIDAIMFYDDEINLRPDYKDEFLDMLREEQVTWRAFFKSGKNLTTEAIFEKTAASGCYQLCTGAESANAKILKDIRKGATLEDNTNFVKYCVKFGIKPKVFTQVGLPGETPESIQELRDWLVRMAGEGLTDADVSITTPYEGTPMYENPEAHDIIFDKEELDFSKEVVLYKGIPGEYKAYVSHKGLSREDLVKARQWVEDEFRTAAGLKPLLAKDDG